MVKIAMNFIMENLDNTKNHKTAKSLIVSAPWSSHYKYLYGPLQFSSFPR